jgi:hypothetical protein
VHLSSPAHDRHVGGHVAVDERAAPIDERPLAIDRQISGEVKRAWRKFVSHVG